MWIRSASTGLERQLTEQGLEVRIGDYTATTIRSEDNSKYCTAQNIHAILSGKDDA